MTAKLYSCCPRQLIFSLDDIISHIMSSCFSSLIKNDQTQVNILCLSLRMIKDPFAYFSWLYSTLKKPKQWPWSECMKPIDAPWCLGAQQSCIIQSKKNSFFQGLFICPVTVVTVELYKFLSLHILWKRLKYQMDTRPLRSVYLVPHQSFCRSAPDRVHASLYERVYETVLDCVFVEFETVLWCLGALVCEAS